MGRARPRHTARHLLRVRRRRSGASRAPVDPRADGHRGTVHGAAEACGEVIAAPCERCRGEGRLIEERTYRSTSRPVSTTGRRFGLPGAARWARGAARPATSTSTCGFAPHDRFARDGHDLVCDLPIAFTQAALGPISRSRRSTAPRISWSPPARRRAECSSCGVEVCPTSAVGPEAICSCAWWSRRRRACRA